MNKLLIVIVVLLMTSAGLSGCNTIEGAGRDIQQGGKAVSETAKEVKRDL
ncbi:MAG: entericidin A/B family lipoprotein [Chromatiaceae bacterium]|nr:MAG: entericidin A/B family lipoprotein [Chromatiaceae bacterium]